MEPRQAYREGEARHREERDRLQRRSAWISTVRFLVFLGAGASYVAWDTMAGAGARVALWTGLLLVAIYLLLVWHHRRVRRSRDEHEIRRRLHEEGLFRLDRDWEALDGASGQDPEGESVPSDHPFAVDLDVLGHASLRRLLGPVTTTMGEATLRGWLLASEPPEAAGERRAAVEELAAAGGFRMELAVRGLTADESRPRAVEALVEWAEDDPWLRGRPGLRIAAWVLPILTILLGLLDPRSGMPVLWIPTFAVQLWLLYRVRRPVVGPLRTVAEGAPALHAFAPQLECVEESNFEAPLLQGLQGRLGEGSGAAHARLRALIRLADVTESRRNLFYAVLSPLLMLDVHLASALDRWRARSGGEVRGWVEALGTVEALSALACLAHDHPDWTFAESTDEPVLRARALGHPLLPPEECVRNDVEVGPAGSFLLVTGSNMSGKSTLLRALGVNLVLAGAGGPVCARAMSVGRFRLWTSMRIDDDLARGVSLFMAELLRVRGIVEAAREGSAEGEPAAESGPVGGDRHPPVFYLLDEILHGTNTAERRVAARAVIRHLLEEGAVGAVSTHDLTLAASEELQARAHAVHFRETVEGGGGDATRLTFDYTLRPGLATTRNALKLLRAVGLGDVLDDEEEPDGDEEPEGPLLD